MVIYDIYIFFLLKYVKLTLSVQTQSNYVFSVDIFWIVCITDTMIVLKKSHGHLPEAGRKIPTEFEKMMMMTTLSENQPKASLRAVS